MRDAMSSRLVRDQRLSNSAANFRATPYGPAIALALSLIAWAAIGGAVFLLL
jgi:hypothetical protein